MLVISGKNPVRITVTPNGFNLAIERLVISGEQSRIAHLRLFVMFQSRNRDACHFRLQGCWTVATEVLSAVSISQSRCLSFQARPISASPAGLAYRFNLAIERLVISGITVSWQTTWGLGSFNLAIEMLVISGKITHTPPRHQQSFNLAIEMLVISGRVRVSRLGGAA